MKTIKTPAALFFILLFSLTSGCNRLLAPSGPSSLSSSSLTAPQADNALSCNLYNFYQPNSGNILFSPFSIITALAMAQEGAAGETASQMQTVLGLSSDATVRRAAFQQLISEINAPGKSYTIDTADDLWPQQGFPILSSFLNVVQTDYFAGVTAVDYANDPSDAVQTIDGAVSQQTEGYIPHLLSLTDISAQTKLFLTNAIYFKADWANQFNLADTTSQNFTLPSSSTVPVSMMQEFTTGQVLTYNGAASVYAMPYANKEASMYIFLPPLGGMGALEAQLSPSNLNTWLAANSAAMTGAGGSSIDLSLPRFTFNSSYNLANTLIQMGMPLAFTKGQADFSGIDGQAGLYLYTVIHKAYINVDELGTTAAAATGVGAKDYAIPSSPIIFKVNHPFIFMIVENTTNTVLFVGRINDPTQTQ